MHEVLVNRLGGLSLPRKSVVRLTDRPDMTLDVYRGRKTKMQQQQQLLLYPTGPNVTKFLLEPLWAEGIKICTNPQGHMTNMATMSSHGKNLYKFLLLNQ